MRQLTNKIRNFGVIAHIDAGKTTTTERILYITQSSSYIGKVEEGTTITDYLYEEKEHGITIQSAAVKCAWKETVFNLIDTPGHIDFMVEVDRSLKVLDSAIVIICGQSGIQAQTENVCRQAHDSQKPLLIYINKLDKPEANFKRVLHELQERPEYTILPIVIPYYENNTLKGVVDLIHQKLILPGMPDKIMEIPSSIIKESTFYRKMLLDTLTNYDDSLLEKIIQQKDTEEDLIASIRKLTIENKITPLLAGSSIQNIGLSSLVDAVANFLPSPADRPIISCFRSTGEKQLLHLENEKKTILYIFKNIYHPDYGEMLFIKIYAGTLNTENSLFYLPTGDPVFITSLFSPFADTFCPLNSAVAGDIVVITVNCEVSLKTGETLCSAPCLGKEYISLEPPVFPTPVIFLKIEPENSEDYDHFLTVKEQLLLEDPTLSYKEDPITGDGILGGMGELHLEIFMERMKNNHGIYLRSGKPEVILKEKADEIYQKKIIMELPFGVSEKTIHAEMEIEISPSATNSQNTIINHSGIPKAEEISNSILKNGLEHEIIDTMVQLSHFKIEKQSIPVGIQYAAISKLFQTALKEVKRKIVEPYMRIEIFSKPESTGIIIRDLLRKKGTIDDISRIESFDKIIAKLPMKNLFGYATHFRSLTCGHGSFSFLLCGYF